jgi:glucose/mannose transport system substrate-binding protein
MDAMQQHSRRRALGLLAALSSGLAGAVAAAGCSEETTPEETGTDQLEIFSWWTSVSEAGALDQLLSLFREDHEGVTVTNTAADASLDARNELVRRMGEGLPPDLFQVSAGQGIRLWVSPSGSGDADSALEPLDDLAGEGGWTKAMPQPVLDVVTFEGKVYAVPVNVHRINCLFYNKKIFDDLGLVPPKNVTEFLAVATTIQAAGITPLSVGLKDKWVLGTMIWESLIPGIAGPQFYVDYLTGKKDPKDPVLRDALTQIASMLDFIDADARTIGWADAVKRVANGAAAMNFMGDWAKGEFTAAGKVPNVDFGVVNWGEQSFVFTTDTFVIPKGAVNLKNGRDLAVIMGSVEGQDAFNPGKGSIPARTDIDPSKYDAISQAAIAEFASPQTTLLEATALMVPNDFADRVIEGFDIFVDDRDVDNLLQIMANYYDILQGS